MTATHPTLRAARPRPAELAAQGLNRREMEAILGYLPHGDGTADSRGNAKDRKRRKLIMLGALVPTRGPKIDFGGDGTGVPCAHGCGTRLTMATVEADRIDPRGGYRITNIRPACGSCNKARGDNPAWRYDARRDAWGPASRVKR